MMEELGVFLWILLGMLVISAFVYEDAKKRDLSNNRWAKSPRDWALGVFLLMIIISLYT